MRLLDRPIVALLLLTAGSAAHGQAPPTEPLPIGVVGLVHGHVLGFFGQSLRRSDVRVVGIAEPDEQLAARYADRYKLDRGLLFTKLDDMLAKTHPRAVVVYTNTFDHRGVVETCARHGVHV